MWSDAVSSTFATILLLVLVVLLFSVGYITFSTIFENGSSQENFTQVTFSQDGEYLNIMPKNFEEPVEVRVNNTKIGELNSPVDSLRYKIEQEKLDKTQIQVYDKNQNQLTQKISANKLFEKSDLTQNYTITIKSKTKKEYQLAVQSQAYYKEQELLYEKEWGTEVAAQDDEHVYYRVLHEFENNGTGKFSYLYNVYVGGGSYNANGVGGFYIGKDGKKEISCNKYDNKFEGERYYDRNPTGLNSDCFEYRDFRDPDRSSSYVDTFLTQTYDGVDIHADTYEWGESRNFEYEKGDQLVAYVHGGTYTHGFPVLDAEDGLPLYEQSDWDRFNWQRQERKCGSAPYGEPGEQEEWMACVKSYDEINESDVPSGLKLYGLKQVNSSDVKVEVAGKIKKYIGTMTPPDYEDGLLYANNFRYITIETTKNIENSDIDVQYSGAPVTASILSKSFINSNNVKVEIPKIDYNKNIGKMTVNNKRENITIQTKQSITKNDIKITYNGQKVIVNNITTE